MGCAQNDLKKVVAYSTCSQLGYMVMVCGLSGYSVSLFHLTNHAFFKALLFLSAGWVFWVAHYNNVYHPYHLVDPSPWPLVGALGAFMATSGGVTYFHNNQPYGMVMGFIIIVCTMVVW